MGLYYVVWLLFLLVGSSFQQSSVETADESECLEWAYEPVVDFIYPQFGERMASPSAGNVYDDIEVLNSVNEYESLPEEFHAPPFEATTVQPWVPQTTTPQYGLPDEFHAPPFEATTVQPWVPRTAKQQYGLPDEFHGPSFQQASPASPSAGNVYNDIELLNSVNDYESLPEEFHAPPFEATTVQPWAAQATKQQYGLPDEFYAPPFDQTSVQQPPQEVLSPLAAAGVLDDEYGLPEYVPHLHGSTVAPVASRAYAKAVPFAHDEFSNGLKDRVVVASVDVPSHTADVRDEFVEVEKEEQPVVRKHYRKPLLSYKKKPTTKSHYVASVTASPRVHDDFASARVEKTRIEPAYLPSAAASVHDGFIGAEHEKKREEKPHREEQSFVDRLFDASPITQFFLDLVGAEAPVHDGFVNGVEDKTIVEPISDHPEPKAKVHDEFTVGDRDKHVKSDDYRAKRAVNGAPSSPSKNAGLWKRVCLKRRPKQKPAPRVLTAADFAEFAQTTNNHIARCIGRHEGESVASGLCRKFYLRCAPTISVLMCSKMNEVFSEARKACVAKTELSECSVPRSVEVRKISFSPEKINGTKEEDQVNLFDDSVSDFCYGKPDGFYRDPKNCSRALQCFDNELFEYPPCAKSLAFDLKRELCDYREKVPSCSN